MGSDSKKCSKCNEEKTLEEFHRDRAAKDGRGSQCKQCVNERAARFREENRDRLRVYAMEYYTKNRDELLPLRRAYQRAHYQENRGRILARHREYQSEHPEVKWAARYRSRALQHGLPAETDPFTKGDVVDRYGDSCFYCETGEFEELDHYVPVSKGGRHTLGNVRPSCHPCNSAKRSADPDEWIAGQRYE